MKLLAEATLNPAFQFRAVVPFEDARKQATFLGVAVDARFASKVQVKGDLEVGLKAADVNGSSYGTEALRQQIEQGTEVAEKALSSFRENVFGNEDVKPEGSVTTLLYISKPKAFKIMAGPVPIVVTSTLQLDLICSFEAKATLKYDLSLDQVSTLKFEGQVRPYATDPRERIQLAGPEFKSTRNFNREILGGGEISLSCGLAPRVNVLLYDAAGINFGARGSLKAKLAYESKCQDNTTTPAADLTLGLYANYGVRVGGRLQAPGSSLLQKKGQDLGIDFGPIEPWNNNVLLKEWQWALRNGIGYCTPLCRNNTLNDANTSSKGKETDVDCGGGSCNACVAGKKCNVHTDCMADGTCDNGVCGKQPCTNGIKDGDETDVDCGGKCGPCATGRTCSSNAGCASGFCSLTTKKCVATSCESGRRDGNEAGVDCGGGCAKCANGVAAGDPDQCASGFSNGLVCVATSCEDGVKSGTETDRDCGGPACNRCGVGMACAATSDCQGGFACTGGVCTRIPDPTCSDRIRNQNESDTDCGGVCPRCGVGQRCSGPQDCVNNVCLQVGTCASAYTLGGTIAGLSGSVTLGGTGVSSVTRTTNGPYSFPTPLVQTAAYAVNIVAQPTGQTCTVANGTGTMGPANVGNVNVTCSTNSFALGGTVTGATGGLTLRNNVGGATVSPGGDGPYSFGSVLFGTNYDVVVQTPPSNQSCIVANGAGTMGEAAVNNITVTCTTVARTVGGTVTGATGPLVLQNGSETLNVAGNGSFTFAQAVAVGAGYAVTVQTAPTDQICTVTNGSGTIGGSNVTNVSVSCVRGYTVGGTISGASGALTLLCNGTDTLNMGGDGSFVFPKRLPDGANFAVTVATPPAGQACTVNNGTSIISGADVGNITITCAVPTQPVDCAAILTANPSATNGAYTIDSDGPSGDAAYQVYCDMTNGGWTQLADQDVTLINPGRANQDWGFVDDTAPNAGQWSMLVRLVDFGGAGTYRMRMTWGDAQDKWIQWDQTANPTSDGTRGTVSNVTMVPTSQTGSIGAFQGLGFDFAQGSIYLDGESGAARGSWGLGVVDGATIPAYAGSSSGALNTNRVRLYVQRP